MGTVCWSFYTCISNKEEFFECKGYAYVRPPFALGTHVPRDTGVYAENNYMEGSGSATIKYITRKLYVTLRYQLPGKPVPDGLQERPTLGPLGLCGRGVCIRLL